MSFARGGPAALHCDAYHGVTARAAQGTDRARSARLNASDVAVAASPSVRLARGVSIVGHPFVTATVLVLASGLRRAGAGEAWSAAFAVVAIAMVPVAILMLRQVRRGAWSDVDASDRRERPVLYLVGLTSLAALLAYLLLRDPASFLVRGALGTVGLLLAAGVATLWVKTSLHTAFAAMAATLLVALDSPAGWPMTVAVPAIAWSRLHLRRHRAVEVVLGGIVGLAAGLAVRYV